MKKHPTGPDPRTLLTSEELDEANRQAIPKVAGASGGDSSTAIFAAIAVGVGLFTFSQMNAARLAKVEPPPAPEPVVIVAAEPEPAPQPPPPAYTMPVAPPSPAEPQIRPERLRAPALIVDLGAPAPEQIAAANAASANAATSLTASEQFAIRAASGSMSPATAVDAPDLSTSILEGSMIQGVLETALNSDLPGYVRAIVSENVRSFDGEQILIPRGSRLVGQYRSGLAIGESRAFVIWTRLILPDGMSISLTSPTTDTLGRAGLGGKVDRHFLQRFGSAILLSIIGAAIDAAVDEEGGQVVISSTTEAFSIAQTALAANMNIPPTIKVAQGTPIRIFVARDLNFPQYAMDEDDAGAM